MSVEPRGWTERPIAEAHPFDPAGDYLAQLGSGSRRTMREALTKLAGWASEGRCGPHDFAWHLLGIEETTALRSRLVTALAPATTNKHLAALRGVLKQCWRQGRMTASAYEMAINFPPARGDSPRKTNKLNTIQLGQLTLACQRDHSAAGARDEALFALLYRANLRRSEAVALNLTDYNLTTGQLSVGGPEDPRRRRLTANEDARRALERWIVVRGSERGRLFNPVNKGGRIERRGLSEQAIYVACQKRAAEAGLPPTSPEDLRRADLSAEDRQPDQSSTSRAETSVVGFGQATPL
jgi:integrase